MAKVKQWIYKYFLLKMNLQNKQLVIWSFYHLIYGTKIYLSEIENLAFVDNLIFLWKDESQKTSHPGINYFCMILFLLEINFIMTVAIKCCIQINLRVIALDNLVFHDSIKSPALLEPKFWRTHVELWVFEFSEFIQVLSDESGIL